MTRPIPLTRADRAFLSETSRVRPANHALVLDFGASADPPFSFEQLHRGAVSASETFPAAAGRLVFRGRRAPVWDPAAGEPFRMVVRTAARREERAGLLQDFVNTDFPLAGPSPVRQLLACFGTPPQWSLLTQAHQAVSDLPGIFQLVRHQLRVAAGESSRSVETQREPPALRQTRRRRDEAEFAEERRSNRLRVFGRAPSARRCWGTISFPFAPFAGFSWSVDGFSWSDVLLAGFLEALVAWNRGAGASASRTGLAVQLDIRERGFHGFGNGTSRILVHRPWTGDDLVRSFSACCRAVGGVALDKRHSGEWAVSSGFRASLLALARERLGRLLGWAGPDEGTASCTLLDGWPETEGELLPGGVVGVELVSALLPRHPIAFGVVPRRGAILVTVTWDAAQLLRAEVQTIIAHFRRLVRSLAARHERGTRGPPGPPAVTQVVRPGAI